MNDDFLGIAGETMGALLANPVMRLASISQAAMNFATVAQATQFLLDRERNEQMRMYYAEIDNATPVSEPKVPAPNAKAKQLMEIRDTAMSHVRTLLAQVKDTPTPATATTDAQITAANVLIPTLQKRRTQLKHGPNGRGGDGPCSPGCEKCSIEQALAQLGATNYP